MSFLATISRPILRASTSRIPLAPFSSSSRISSDTPAEGSSKKLKGKKKTVVSSCAPGTVMHGLNILKDKSDPVAKADDEYPDWLWTILSPEKNAALAEHPRQEPKPGQEFDFVREKKRLRAVNKAGIKASNFLKST